MIRILVVDDEALARRTIEDVLAAEPDVDVVASCGTGEEALELLALEEVDLVFLDIEMPGVLGLEVVGRIPAGVAPLVIFVTAHSEHAVEAFELSALDYVLKPFEDDRLRRALDRARSRLTERRIGSLGDDLRTLAERLASIDTLSAADPGGSAGRGRTEEGGGSPDAGGGHSFAVRSHRGVELVDHSDVVWIEAEDAYVRLHAANGRTHLMRHTMSRLELELDPDRFVRVHRSAIVRLDLVRRWISLDHGDAKIVLLDGTEVRVSRSRRASVRAALGF